jgi:ABC-type amino acid transport substrate-binding protein
MLKELEGLSLKTRCDLGNAILSALRAGKAPVVAVDEAIINPVAQFHGPAGTSDDGAIDYAQVNAARAEMGLEPLAKEE